MAGQVQIRILQKAHTYTQVTTTRREANIEFTAPLLQLSRSSPDWKRPFDIKSASIYFVLCCDGPPFIGPPSQ